MKSRMFPCFLSILLLTPLLGFSQDTINSRLTVDWEKRIMILDAELLFAGPQALGPRLRSSSEQAINERLSNLMREKTADLPLDSSIKVGTFTGTDPFFLKKIDDFAGTGSLTRSHLSQDMKKFQTTYVYDLSAFGALFVSHTIPSSLPPFLTFEPSASFSGCVIYMKTDLPVIGEREREGPDKGLPKMTRVKPCLFPKLYDEDMNLILEKGMMKPDFVKRWGVVGYSSAMEAPVERVGFTPLKIMGRAVFGTEHTDIVIASEAARKLLAQENNRRLLTEGRIVVICDPY